MKKTRLLRKKRWERRKAARQAEKKTTRRKSKRKKHTKSNGMINAINNTNSVFELMKNVVWILILVGVLQGTFQFDTLS